MADNEINETSAGLVVTVIDSDILISEVEKRPALYNKELKEYSDRNVKEKLWAEVCAQVIPNWNDLPAREKKTRGKM